LSATLTFAQTRDCDITEQYVDLDNSINFIFMRDQNQEGGTSTPGKRPGCSEHILTLFNNNKTISNSMGFPQAIPNVSMDHLGSFWPQLFPGCPRGFPR